MKREHLLLGLIVLGTAALQLIRASDPFIAHFGSYQAIVGMIAREFARQNFANFLMPNSTTLTGGLPSLEMIYHPMDAFWAALGWKFLGGSLDFWGRFQAVFFTALSSLCLYGSVRRLLPERRPAALAAVLFYSLSPMVFLYGRSLMNEAFALFLSLLALFLLLSPRQGRGGRIFRSFMAGLLLSAVLVLRLHFVVLVPAFGVLLFLRCPKGIGWGLRVASLASYSLGAVLLAGLWFWHTYQLAATLPNLHTSLFLQTKARPFPDPLLFAPDFYLQLARDLLLRLWGPVGLVVLLFGLVSKEFRRESCWVAVGVLCAFLAILKAPEKFHDHPFYLLSIMPLTVLWLGLGFERSLEFFRNIPEGEKKSRARSLTSAVGILIIGAAFCSSALLVVRPGWSMPSEQKAVLEAAAFLRDKLPPKAVLVAAHGSSCDLLYYSGRYGYGFQIIPGRRKLSKYEKIRDYSHLSVNEFEEKNRALLGGNVSWLEYLRAKGGATHFAVVPKSDLANDPALARHLLRKQFRLLSPPEADYAVYSLNKEAG